MEDCEYDLLDELYFVTSYDDLQRSVDLDEEEIRDTLSQMSEKKWIRVYQDADTELEDFDIMANFKSYFYLASKKGLMAHNSQ